MTSMGHKGVDYGRTPVLSSSNRSSTFAKTAKASEPGLTSFSSSQSMSCIAQTSSFQHDMRQAYTPCTALLAACGVTLRICIETCMKLANTALLQYLY